MHIYFIIFVYEDLQLQRMTLSLNYEHAIQILCKTKYFMKVKQNSLIIDFIRLINLTKLSKY